MTDASQYQTYGSPDLGRDVTAVMGRRTVAWVLDAAIFLAVVIAMFSSFAEYVEIPPGVGDNACALLRQQDSDAATSCFVVGERAYIISGGESASQTLVSVGYLAFFIVLQGLAGGSPGKLLLGLRVVGEDGERAGVGKSLVRTLLWAVDGAPWFLPIVGFIVGLTSTGHRRVGDMAASTYVVARRDVGKPVNPSSSMVPSGQTAWGAPPTAGPPTAAPPPSTDASGWSTPPASTPPATTVWSTPPTAQPPTSQPPTAEAGPPPTVPMPPPQWDTARNAYIQWYPPQQAWLQWDPAGGRWKPIDT